MAYPPVGFFVPFKILRPRSTFLRRCLAMNGRSASAAPCPFRPCLLLQARSPRLCPSFDAVRHRVREVAHSGVPLVAAIPRGLEPMSTANAVFMGRHVHRGQAASSLTPGGHCTLCRALVESMSPSHSTGQSIRRVTRARRSWCCVNASAHHRVSETREGRQRAVRG